ncbi:MAG TPA: PorV/PorQ family protein [Candidatus Eisenbacteria bacterium]|nr:PorV/PorQ family protein [Candidatus Eisenbacteria bacterium]
MQTQLAGPRRPSRLSGTISAALITCALILYGGVRPAAADVSVGTSGGGFLNFEVGGRPAGMGGAQVSTATGVTAQFWNPAGLAWTDQGQVGAMHAKWLDNLSYEWLGYAKPLGPRLGVGSLSVAYFHMPAIQGVDEFDNPTQSYRVYDMAVTAGLARPVSRHVSVGANVRYIRQSLATVSATGIGVDLGATGTFSGLAVAAVAQNLGPNLSYDGASYPLPRMLRFGVSRPFLQQKLLLAADYNIPRDYFKDARFGAEYRVHPLVSLRMGYRHVIGSSNDPSTGMSYGLGLHAKQLSVDYAMTPSDAFDNVHRIGFGYSFGGGAEESETKPEAPKEQTPLPPAPPKGPTTVASAPQPKKNVKPAEPVRVLAESKSDSPAPSTATAPPVASAAPAKSETVAAAPQAAKSAPVVAQTSSEAPVVKDADKQGAVTKESAPTKEAKPAKPITEYAVILPGYQSKEGAQGELKALQLLGFRTKDAAIVASPKGGYAIRLAQMKSKGSAEDMISSLSRMSFRATMETVQR